MILLILNPWITWSVLHRKGLLLDPVFMVFLRSRYTCCCCSWILQYGCVFHFIFVWGACIIGGFRGWNPSLVKSRSAVIWRSCLWIPCLLMMTGMHGQAISKHHVGCLDHDEILRKPKGLHYILLWFGLEQSRTWLGHREIWRDFNVKIEKLFDLGSLLAGFYWGLFY